MKSLFSERRYFGKVYPSHPFLYFLGGLVLTAKGLVMVVTLGFCNPIWDIYFYSWLIKSRCALHRKEAL
jgi:hypothetical protein